MQRYLFFDDREVERREGLTRTVHHAQKHPGNPIMKAEPAWEGAMVPSTVLFDDEAGCFKMWYLTHARVPGAESTYVTGYATSIDGLSWERPNIGAYEHEGSRQNNLCMVNTSGGMGVVKDMRDPDPARRFKTLFWRGGNRAKADVERGWGAKEQRGFYAGFSPDGAHWTLASEQPVLTGTGDTESLFGWDEAYERYVAYVRPGRAVRRLDGGTYAPKRVIGRSESEDFSTWTVPLDVVLPDADDPPGAEHYYMPVLRYHGHYVGIVHVYVPTPDPFGPFWPELTHSRDGLRWRRLNEHGSQRLLHPGEPGSFDSGMIRCARGIFEHGDELWLYYGGWHEDHGLSRQHRHMTTPREAQRNAAAIGLSTLRRDGFVSLDAGGESGSLVTVPLRCGGEPLTINAAVQTGGSVTAELLDESSNVVAGCGLQDCDAVGGDFTRHVITWSGSPALDRLAGARVRVRLVVKHAALYSFDI